MASMIQEHFFHCLVLNGVSSQTAHAVLRPVRDIEYISHNYENPPAAWRLLRWDTHTDTRLYNRLMIIVNS